ncbi:MAG TPA: DinB family protein [Longimicrobium sp.]
MPHPAHVLRTGFRLHTRLFLNSLEEMDDDAARTRPGERTNSIAFIALHLVDVRHFTLEYAGGAMANPFTELLAGISAIDDLPMYPPLDEIRGAWSSVSASLDARLGELDGDALAATSPQRYPVDDPTVAGGLTFLLSHEAYHIGQMALLRKHLGFPAMTYR